jgi:hypothetical protein
MYQAVSFKSQYKKSLYNDTLVLSSDAISLAVQLWTSQLTSLHLFFQASKHNGMIILSTLQGNF